MAARHENSGTTGPAAKDPVRRNQPRTTPGTRRRNPSSRAADGKLLTTRAATILTVAVTIGILTGHGTAIAALGTLSPDLALFTGIPAGLTAGLTAALGLHRLVR
ncbi:hypothetical protein [Longispora albida]|uniref:hypothetical protein n=1 Tax=Longispora albida TaxID=203523 RepID=UPI0003780208|nr:hypothetical protein [Longispora albida]